MREVVQIKFALNDVVIKYSCKGADSKNNDEFEAIWTEIIVKTTKTREIVKENTKNNTTGPKNNNQLPLEYKPCAIQTRGFIMAAESLKLAMIYSQPD